EDGRAHVVPLRDLVKQNSVDETAEAESEHETGGGSGITGVWTRSSRPVLDGPGGECSRHRVSPALVGTAAVVREACQGAADAGVSAPATSPRSGRGCRLDLARAELPEQPLGLADAVGLRLRAPRELERVRTVEPIAFRLVLDERDQHGR